MAHLPAATVLYPRTHPLRSRHLCRRVLTLTSLGLAGLVAGLLSGCSTAAVSTATSSSPATSFVAVSGNWRVSVAGAPAATALSVLGGSLSVSNAQASGSQVSGLLHPLTAGQCLDPAETIAVSGSITPAGILTVTGQSSSQTAANTTITLTGTVAPDRHSLTSPTLSVTGGRCIAATAAAQTSSQTSAAHPDDNTGSTTAQQYQPVSGTYTGTLTTAEGETFPLTTTVTQLDQPDIYHLQGSAASAGNTCLPSSVTAAASILSGGTLSATYTDANGATSITASGSVSPDASTLTLTQWQITSTCGSDTGTGTLTRQ